jgi:hypothetical protein
LCAPDAGCRRRWPDRWSCTLSRPVEGEIVTLIVRRANGVAHLPDCEWLPVVLRDPEEYERTEPRSYWNAARESARRHYTVREVLWPPRLRICPTCARRLL